MKRIICFVVFCFVSCSMIFCLASYDKKEKANSVVTVCGLVVVKGNEPFTFLGLKTENGKEYALKGKEDILDYLQNNQGVLFEITGFLEKKSKKAFQQLKNGAIYVSSVKVVENPK